MSEGAKTGQSSAPAGTGNTPGLGEAFSINLNTGQGMYSYKFPLPDGVAGHTPRLALEYAHGQGASPYGFGWRLPVRMLSRRLDYGVPALDSSELAATERFMDSGTELVRLPDGSYHTLIDTIFTKYSRIGDTWKVEERNGIVHELGRSVAGRLVDPGRSEHIHQWLLERTTDPSGNAIDYAYEFRDDRAYLRQITYAAYAVRFEYEARPDIRTDGRLGFQTKLAQRCSRIVVVLDPGAGERPIRSWTLGYQLEPWARVSLLTSITLRSHGAMADGSQDVLRTPVTFAYSGFHPKSRHVYWMDVEGDGPMPPPLTERDVALVNMDNTPLPGVLQVIDGKQYYWRNRGDGSWGYPTPVARAPNVRSFAREGLALVDMDASGTADLLVAASEALPGYYENGGRQGWSRFVAFPRGRRTAPAWTSPGLRLFDADNDGRIDAVASVGRSYALWRNQGESGWSEPRLTPRANGSPDLAESNVHLADMTGDGQLDIVRVGSGRVEYWPSLGNAHFGPPVVMQSSPRLGDLARNAASVLFIDVNGDGCADLVHVTSRGIEVYINQNGSSFGTTILIPDVPSPIPGTVRPINLSGHPVAGLVWNSVGSRGVGYVAFEFASVTAHVLNRIDNGAGLISNIAYRSAVEDYERDRARGELWQTNFPFPYVVVAGTDEADQVTGRRTQVEFRYHEAHFSPSRRQFQGFRRSERIEVGDASRADTVTVMHFLADQERLSGNGPEHAALNGMLRRTEIYSADGSAAAGSPYRVEEADHILQVLDTLPDGRKRVFVGVSATRNFDSERTSDSRNEEKLFAYDAVGNVTRERHRGYGVKGGVNQPERLRVTEISYATSSTCWLVDRVAGVVVRDENGRILKETRRYYDGSDFTGLALGQATRGLLMREQQRVFGKSDFDTHYVGMDTAALGYSNGTDADGTPAVFADASRFAYSANGVKTASKDEVGNLTVYEYEAQGLFRVGLTDSFGRTSFEYDRVTGQVTHILYPDSTEAHFAYDAQGRITATALPGETLADAPRRYQYDDRAVPNCRTALFRFAAGPAGLSQVLTYFDGGGKEIQQRIQTSGGKFVVSGWQTLNAWGEPASEFEPTLSDDTQFSVDSLSGKPRRDFFYDGRGRVIRVVNYSGGASTATFLPFDVITRDANDNDRSAENQARGQVDTPHREQFDTFRYLTSVSEDLGGGSSVTTSYETSSNGEVVQIADARGVMCRFRYDSRGNRIQIDQRDGGTRKLWYDARKLIVRTLDANGNDMRATLDERGRLKTLSAGVNVLEQYTYDVAAQNALGRLAEVSYPGGRQKLSYSKAGSLIKHEYVNDGIPLPEVLTYEYDLLGREIAVTHGATRIARTLTPNGWVQSIPGFVDRVEYDARGHALRIAYHNGVTTDFTYTAGPGREKTRVTRNAANQILENVSYEFDQLEVLIGSDDAAPGGLGKRSYSFDPLYQIKGMTSIENGAPVTRQYTYANMYNLTRFDEGRNTMHYDDAAHPDRVAGMTPDGQARVNIGYDANGNMINLPRRTFSYNAKNELVRVDAAGGLKAEYRYDHEGRRVSKVVTQGVTVPIKTLFLGDLVEIRQGQPAYFIKLANLRVAIVAQGATRYAHNDYLGNTNFFTDANGTKIAAIAYHPFGNIHSASGMVDLRMFGAHPFDTESGLFYMRKRYYAPEIGRFVTPDPLAIYQPEKYLTNQKGLHLYIYVANDPLNKTDPTGLSFWSVLGGIVGVIVGVIVAAAVIALTVMTFGTFGVFVGIMVGLGLTVAGFGVMAVAYVIASATAGTAFGEFMRGFLIGFNAGMNAALATAIFGPVVGVALGVVNFLAVFDGIAKNSVYQGILGWSSWLMPMSWLATAVGLILFVVNVVVAFFTVTIPGWFGGSGWAAARIDSVNVDWGTGSIVMAGGLIQPAGGAAGFNVGNFVFIASGSGGNAGLVAHETGHTLNVAAFGSLFHFVGALDENWPGNRGPNAYAEMFAESHSTRGGRPTLPMWG